ncbi:hypothetical protein ACI1UN_03195 [Lactococcus petauri]|uniref:Uncharacterized protein n=1 Tax=Lactococcus garvieae TaxID=1363 RepID=A0AA46TTZ6_9LACT|nr:MULTISPECIES: hypothetical protein [Lactococcus]KXT62614.1 hypothetical protein LACDD01_00552 [Lactococcus sp. DD01]MBD5824398.1 hypothetical protein [Lactococcus petauri]MDC0825850.1 hypothetical protein [Lactococcus petauri]NHI77299.1 hypothetical protein [Lactococcus petauri]RGB57789.1 hypothetical protein DW155_08885 [Lactococcus petauri]
MIDKYNLPKEELLSLLMEESKLAPQHQLPGEEIEGVNVTMQFLRDETGQVRYLPRRKVMGYDLDGVIFSMKKAIECTNQKLGTNLNIETMEAIDYDLIYYATMDEDIQRKIIRESTPNRKMVEDLAEEHLNGAEIVLITARHVSYAKETIESLNRFGIYYDKIYFTEEKLPLIIGLDIDWFYDDKPETIAAIKNHKVRTKAVLVSAPYNRGATDYDYRYKVGLE